MIRIYKTTFDSAHCIKGHSKCGETHGHTYHITVRLSGNENEWLDFHEIKEKMNNVLLPFDHHNMGDMTCELLARIIKTSVCNIFKLPEDLISIELFETESFGVML